MAFRKRSLLVAAALSAVTAQAQEVPDLYTVQVDGACDSQSFLNGLMYDRMGYTLNGHPYYKARGMEEYLYYDEDCANVGDGMARWILDNDRPALDRDADLDNDGTCSYHARINSPDGSKPPATGVWRMRCGTSWTSVTLSLTMVTSTSTSTTTTSTTTTSTATTSSTTTSTTTTTETSTTTSTTTTTSSTTSTTTTTTTTGTTTTVTTTSTTSTTTSTTTTTTTLMWFHVSGMCEYKQFLNDMVFRQGGYTANGAPWFKSLSGDQYVYYDVDCNGDAYGGEPRWIIDNDAPNVDGVVDMDGDGACNYHARLDTLDTTRPPTEGLWKVFCGHDWEFIDVRFDHADPAILEDRLQHPPPEIDESNATTASDPGEDPQSTTTSTTTTTITNTTTTRTTSTSTRTTTVEAVDPMKQVRKLSFDGACEEKAFLRNLTFEIQGHTASGAPYYKAVTTDGEAHYMYYDPACGGMNGKVRARWILDTDEPDVNAEMDLDHDGKCEYYGRSDGYTLNVPPEAMWRLFCGTKWEDHRLSVVEHAVVDAALPAMSGFATTLAVAGAVVMAAGWC